MELTAVMSFQCKGRQLFLSEVCVLIWMLLLICHCKLAGMDIAFISNGYVYHTPLDQPSMIPPGCIQRAGEYSSNYECESECVFMVLFPHRLITLVCAHTRCFSCHFSGKPVLAGCSIDSQSAVFILIGWVGLATEYFGLYLTHLH